MSKNTIPWKYNDTIVSSLEDMPQNVFGFVYETLYTETNHKYIGKKQIHYTKKKKLTKKQLAEYEGKRGRKPTHEFIAYESDWKNYYGSHPIIKELADTQPHNLQRNILEYAFNKKQLTYLECKHLFCNDVLNNDEYLNLNILGKFFRDEYEDLAR